METMLRLQCDNLLGGRAGDANRARHDRSVAQESEGLVAHVIDDQEGPGLEHLQGLQARDCDDLQRRVSRPDVTVTMPTG
jgi:hypothetical protein